MEKMRKMESIGIPILFIMTLILGFSLVFYLGNDNQAKPLENYIKDNRLSVNFDEKTDKLEIVKNNIKWNQIKNFTYIKHIRTANDSVSVELSDNLFSKAYNYMMFGYPLKNEIAFIKVSINNIDNINVTTNQYLQKYYDEFYPYNVVLCGTNSNMFLKVKTTECEPNSRVIININTIARSHDTTIDYYPEWDGVAERFMIYNKVGIQNKLSEYSKANELVQTQYLSQLNKFKIDGIYPPNIVIVDGKFMKTTRTIKSELMIVKERNEDYIESNISKTAVYVNYNNQNDLIEDINYVLNVFDKKQQAAYIEKQKTIVKIKVEEAKPIDTEPRTEVKPEIEVPKENQNI